MSKPSKQSDPQESRLEVWKRYEEAVRQGARGRWYEIIPYVDPRLANAVAANGKGVPCPITGKGKDGFRILNKQFAEMGGSVSQSHKEHNKSGFATLMWSRKMTYGEVVKEVGEFLGMPWAGYEAKPKEMPVTPAAPIKRGYDEKELHKNRKRILDHYNASKPVVWTEDHPVVIHLKHRGLHQVLGSPPKDWFFHPKCPYYHSAPLLGEDGKLVLVNGKPKMSFVHKGDFPAILFLIKTPEGKAISMQRYYLDPKTYKKLSLQQDGEDLPQKKELATHLPDQLHGSAIPLDDWGPEVIISEGVMTAIGAKLVHARKHKQLLPAIATISAGGMERLLLPPIVQRVHIYADNDDPMRNHSDNHRRGRGLVAAENFRAANPNVDVIIHMNPVVDEDWNDEWVRLSSASHKRGSILSKLLKPDPLEMSDAIAHLRSAVSGAPPDRRIPTGDSPTPSP